MIKNILFDLDDTLFDFHAAEKIALTKTLKSLGVPTDEKTLKRYSEINLSQWELLEEGKINREEVKTRRFKILYEEIGSTASEKESALLYEDNLSIGHIYLDGAEELLENLYQKYNLYIVSNGTAKVQDGRIKSSGIAKYFKDIFISERVGANKPSIEFFNFCFSKIPNFKREETIIIGDSLTSDIKGGKNAQIKTVWFNPHKKTSTDIFPDYEIASLSEFHILIKSL